MTARGKHVFLMLSAWVGPSCDQQTNPQGLMLLGNQVPDQSCKVSAQIGGGGAQAFRGEGILDLALATEYGANLLVINALPTTDELTGLETDDGRLDANAITLTHVEMSYQISDEVLQCREAANGCLEVDDPSLNVDPLIYESQGLEIGAFPGDTSNAFLTISPAGAGALGGIQLIRHNRGLILRQLPIIQSGTLVQMKVTARVYGRLADAATGTNGTVIRSAPFVYPITLCWRCLVIDSVPLATAQDTALHEGLDDAQLEIPCVLGNDTAMHNPVCALLFDAKTSCEGKRCVDPKAASKVCGSDVPMILP